MAPFDGLFRLLLPIRFALRSPIIADEFLIQNLNVLLRQLPRPLLIDIALIPLA